MTTGVPEIRAYYRTLRRRCAECGREATVEVVRAEDQAPLGDYCMAHAQALVQWLNESHAMPPTEAAP